MKLLVATEMTNGIDENDHKMAIIGESVYLATHCDKLTCSCQISFEGLISRQLTTTAIVKEVEYTIDEFISKCLRLSSKITQQEIVGYLALVNGMEIGQLVRREANNILIVNSFYY